MASRQKPKRKGIRAVSTTAGNIRLGSHGARRGGHRGRFVEAKEKVGFHHPTAKFPKPAEAGAWATKLLAPSTLLQASELKSSRLA